MSEVHEQALIDAPVSSVWELVGDPRRYPDWLPRVFEVQGERFEEGTEFIQISRQPLVGRDEAHFLIDEMDELREIRMHCTISGMFAHWQLTEAQGGTFGQCGIRDGPPSPPRPRHRFHSRTPLLPPLAH
jgi:uncharacterized protein YndB with AHSA1/START domain